MSLSKPPDPPPDKPSPPPPPSPSQSKQVPPSKSEPPFIIYPPKNQDSLANTIYFQNFPEFQNETEFKSLLKSLLPIKEIRLIQKKNKAGKKFGFLKCDQAMNIQSAINILNGIWIGNHKIYANKAKYNMISKRVPTQNFPSSKPSSDRIPNLIAKSTDIRTYAEVMKGEKSTHMEKISMIYDTRSEIPNWLQRSCLGVLRSLELIPHIHQIVSSRYPGSEVRVLGGNLIITTFPHSALKEKSFKDENVQWTSNFFDLWRDWDKHDVAQGRFAWLKISRVPLHVWKTDFFKSLVCGYGDFIHISIIEDGIQELLFPLVSVSPFHGEITPEFVASSLPSKSDCADHTKSGSHHFESAPPFTSDRMKRQSSPTDPIIQVAYRSPAMAGYNPDISDSSPIKMIAPSSSRNQNQFWRPLAERKSPSIVANSPSVSIVSRSAVDSQPPVTIAKSQPIVANSLSASSARSSSGVDSSPPVAIAKSQPIVVQSQSLSLVNTCPIDDHSKLSPKSNSPLISRHSPPDHPASIHTVADYLIPANHAEVDAQNLYFSNADKRDFFLPTLAAKDAESKEILVCGPHLSTSQSNKEKNKEETHGLVSQINTSLLNVEGPTNQIISTEEFSPTQKEIIHPISDSPSNSKEEKMLSKNFENVSLGKWMDLRKARKKARKKSIIISKKSMKIKKLSSTGSLLSIDPGSNTPLHIEYVSDSDINAGNGRFSFPPKDLESDSHSEAEEILQLGLQVGLELNRAWDEAMNVTHSLVLENNQQTVA